MRDLQTGLILIGLVLILVVMLFNWWQDRRVKMRMRQQFPDAHDDALLASAPQSEQRREPVLGAVSEAMDEDDEVDPQCEAVIDVAFAHPIAAEPLLQALQSLVRTAAKPIRVFAQRDDDGQRAHLHLGEPCTSLQLAVLLANRRGPLSAIEWSGIWTQVQALAAQFDGVIEGPEQDQVVRQAAQLDALCAGLDATVNLCVKLTNALPLDHVQRLAHEMGFAAHGQHLVWMADQGTPHFTLLFNSATMHDMAASPRVERLDLVLDVPNSPASTDAFSRMASVGHDLANALHAVLLDDQGKPLAAHTNAIVDQQLVEITRRLEAAGFTPGSARCARVFA